MMVNAPTVVLTRPVQDLGPWLQALQAQQMPTIVLPLLRIGSVADTAALSLAWQHLARGQYAAVMGVSGNAFRAFWAAQPEGLAIPSETRFWATGAGSAAALQALGVAAKQIDQPAPDAAQMDSEHLWPVVAPQLQGVGQRVLLLRGMRGIDLGADVGVGVGGADQPLGNPWLATQLQTAGVHVDELAVYQRLAPLWGPVESALLQLAVQRHAVWLLSSSEAVRHLPADINWPSQRAIATHPRIAQVAVEHGFGQVVTTQPRLASVMAAVQALQPRLADFDLGATGLESPL